MHVSLDSALGRQRRLNQVGETISSIAAPTAAYSLRSITGGDPKVVRVRRESDNNERDFTASEVSSGALVDFVNTQVTAPLDIQALTATGRDGDFLIAKAAYSLRSLGTRQATVAATGDTVARANGKYVCQVRSVTSDIKSFTADEVSDGTLVDFVLGNTKSLLNSRAYFDGSNDNVGLTSEINLTGDFSLEYSFVVTEASQQIIGKNAGGSYLRAEGSTEITGFRIQTDGSAATVSLTSNLKYGEANTIKLKRVSGKFGIYNESDTLISAEFTNSDTFTISSFGKARGSFAKGVIYNIRIDTNNDGTIDHSYNGYGNSVSDWTDLVGSNNAVAVNGSPALFTGQDQDGFVKTWYDQSVTTQAGDTATGNHATQATAGSQPKIVDAGSLITGEGIAFDGSDDQLDFTALNATDLAIFSVVKFDSVSGQERILGEDSSNGEGFGIGSATTGFFRGNGGSSSGPALNATVSTSGDFLYSANRASNTLGFFTNGVASATATNSDAFKANSIGGSTNPIDGNVKEIIIYETDQTDNRTAIEANMGEHYSISGIPAFDNSVNGFVETWYDQFGSNNLTQATASKQPTIVTSGTLNTRNNEPIIKFIQANSNVLLGPSTIPPTGTDFALTCFQALHIDPSSGNRVGTFGSSGGGSNAGTSKYRFGSGTSRKITVRIQDASDTVTALESLALSNDTDSILTYMIKLNDGSLEFQTFNLGAQLGSTQTSSVTDQSYDHTHDTILGARSPSDNFSDSEFFEVLFYATDQLTNRDAIEANLSNKYGISLS